MFICSIRWKNVSYAFWIYPPLSFFFASEPSNPWHLTFDRYQTCFCAFTSFYVFFFFLNNNYRENCQIEGFLEWLLMLKLIFCVSFLLSERPWLVDSYDQWLERLKVRLFLCFFIWKVTHCSIIDGRLETLSKTFDNTMCTHTHCV